ncbi:hypothetical protein BG011_008604 [Mortierella polycephala]|uniref:Uncharacterized protein n=1 Tax=Mortierella polycephala TaxID=41804 RepID=A0A9P6PQ64_9FUNG|nr:hypothetical protein BG011_008604 [Mortierella polycephala]
MDNNIEGDSTPDRGTRTAEGTPRHHPTAPRTPRTPTSSRIKSTATGRPSPPTYSAASAVKHSLSRPRSGISSNNNTPTRIKNSENTDSTTPVYAESTNLINNSISNAKLQLSDMQPVNKKILERIKSLEISLNQHHDSESQLARNIDNISRDLSADKEQHQQALQASKTRLEMLRQKLEQKHAKADEIISNLDELYEQELQMMEEKAGMDKELQGLNGRLDEMKESKEQILREREETEADALEELRKKKEDRQAEYDDIRDINKNCSEQLDELENGPDMQRIMAKLARKEEMEKRIEELDIQLKEKMKAREIEGRDVQKMLQYSQVIYEQRIRSHQEDADMARRAAEEIERKREKEANAAREEFDLKYQQSIEEEEMASQAEFELLTAKDDLSKLELALQDLKTQLESARLTTVMES